jgi:catechol 2,3-dioxygenase-like lactoylglutathione lyase family enzyme
MMARIRHIAFASDHPGRTAEFYKAAFGFAELARYGLGHDLSQEAPRPSAVILSDGNINVAILKLNVDQTGVGLDHQGFHHFGVVVDDIDGWTQNLKRIGAEQLTGPEDMPPNAHFEIKFKGPDGVVFDISPSPWPGASSVPAPGTRFGAAETAKQEV